MPNLFISFVSQDKQVAQSLSEKLESNGITSAPIKLGLGDSLMARIEQGFRDFEYGVLILSPSFFRKSWPRNEMDKMATMDLEFDGRTLLFPYWHEISQQDIARYSSPLASRVGGSSEEGLEQFVYELTDIIRESNLASDSSAYNKSIQQKMVSPELADNSLTITHQLNDVLLQYFSLGELTDLAWDLNIDIDDIQGKTKSSKARELISYCQRRGILEELMRAVQVRRPFITW